MNLKIDLKSLLSGVAAGVGVTIALGASTNSTPSGRFQITGTANYLAVIDSETGQVWAGNFNQLGQGSPGFDFRNCPQSSGDLFRPKPQ
jgi:hypothetical protein